MKNIKNDFSSLDTSKRYPATVTGSPEYGDWVIFFENGFWTARGKSGEIIASAHYWTIAE